MDLGLKGRRALATGGTLAGRASGPTRCRRATTCFEGGVWSRIERDNPAFFAEALALNPMGRMGKPEEMARAAVSLASPAASFASGTNLVVDGALTRGVQLRWSATAAGSRPS